MLATMAFTAALGASAMAAPAAGAFDLTGTWSGTLTCNGFDGAKETAKFVETMTVLQFGTCKWTYKRTDATPPSITPCP